MATITSEAWTNQSPKNVNTYPHTYLLSSKTMRGSLFPLLPLGVKCQNHERVPIAPISPILVVHALSSCQDMGHQNRENFHGFGTSSRENTERVPISPISPKGEVQNHERVPISLFWWSMPCHLVKTWATKIEEIRTLSYFWHFIKGKHWEGPYFPYFPEGWNAKTMRRSLFPLFPLFWWSMSWQDGKIGPENRGNRGNRDLLMVLALHP